MNSKIKFAITPEDGERLAELYANLATPPLLFIKGAPLDEKFFYKDDQKSFTAFLLGVTFSASRIKEFVDSKFTKPALSPLWLLDALLAEQAEVKKL